MDLFRWAKPQPVKETRLKHMNIDELREYAVNMRAAGQTQQWFISRMREICERNWDELPSELRTFLSSDHE